jgi:hypothetical protein
MGIARIRKNKNNPYVQMDKRPLQDVNLSWKAKGILAYLLSLPDDWQIYISEIEKHSTDKRGSTDTGFKELIKKGYIVKENVRNESGQFKGVNYSVYEKPCVDRKVKKAVFGKPEMGKSKIGKLTTTNIDLTKKDITKNDNIKKREEPQQKQNEIKEIWNSNITGNIPKIKMITKSRMSNYNKRVKEGLDLLELINVIVESDFLQGDNKNNWIVTFDWIIANEKNWIKIIEGNYKNAKFEKVTPKPEWARHFPKHTK